jgi:hypothetical protein
MYNVILTPEQEKEAKIELCTEEYCIRCDSKLVDASERCLVTIPYRTKKHLYCNCFIVCQNCFKDGNGMIRWFNNIDAQEALYMAKDRSCFVITLR